MSSTVDALLPLSFLEAVRSVDSPDDQDAEWVPELRNKRFGLSDTVYAQIQRYADAVKRRQRAIHDEVVALARLIGRRPDAEAVFRAAGRYLANETYNTIPDPTRRMLHTMPQIVARPIALRQMRRIAQRSLSGSVTRVGSSLMLQVPMPVTVDSAPLGVGCAYYEATMRELLRLLAASSDSVEHVRCASRGEGMCEWRAEWRAMDRRATA